MNDFARTTTEGPQLRTILLTDLVDSTSLVERLGDVAASELFREHDRLVLQLQGQWRGRLIDRSDGLLLLFERPIDGLGFALDYARGLRDMGTERGLELQARAGLHVGEVLTWKNSDAAVLVGAKPLEVEGLAKPMAARMMTLARPGQILLSAMAEPLARRAARELGERGEHLLWKSYGRWRFKGVPEAHEIFEVGEVGIAPLRPPSNMPKAWRDIPLWRRPAAMAAAAVVVAGLGFSTWFLTRPQPAIAFSERDWVVVGDLRNLTGQGVLDDSLAQAFRISLEQSRYVNVLSDLKTRDTLARMQREPGTPLDRAVASEIALRDGARAVILPTVSEVGGRVRVSAEVIDPSTQTTVYAETADGVGVDSTLASIDKVTSGLRSRLGEALASVQQDSAPLPEVTTSNLDALRAYALAQKAMSNRQWQDAIRYYENAVSLDPGFALAYMGLVRMKWSSMDYAAALPYLSKALALRASLPQRDQLYLDAWVAETRPTGSPLEKWKLLAGMYPDYFAGLSNASWYLFVENRFDEALPYAQAAAVPQDPLRAFPIDHIGRIQLATGKTQAALDSFLLAEKEGGGTPIRYRADALAVLGRYDEAWRVLDAVPTSAAAPSSLYVNLDRTSVALDQGDFTRALANAQAGARAASELPGRSDQFTLLAHAAAVLADPQTVQSEDYRRFAESLLADPPGVESTTHGEHLFNVLLAAHLAQRGGNVGLARRLLRAVEAQVPAVQRINLDKWLAIVQAHQHRLEGRPEEAVRLLKPQLDGRELYQARSALLAAYQAIGDTAGVVEQSKWLAANRGRAYVEVNVNQLLQPLNVADSRLGHLAAYEALDASGSPAAAAVQRDAFLQAWPEAGLPDHLRRRLDATLPASKQKMMVNAAPEVR